MGVALQEEGVHYVEMEVDGVIRIFEGQHENHEQGDESYGLWDLTKDLVPGFNTWEALGEMMEACK
jgi:hypothetical protein